MPLTKSNDKPLVSADPGRPALAWSFEAIGTQWWIGLYEPLQVARLERLKREVSARIEQFDAVYSRFRQDSVVARLSLSGGQQIFPADSIPLLGFYRQLYEITDGAVTPLIGQLLSDAGYDASYSLRPGELRDVPAWDAVLQVRGASVRARQPVLLDFGAAGKGYLVDLICDVMQGAQVRRFCVDAGGDVRCVGLDPPLSIGLEHPDNAGLVIGVVQLKNGALCGSAGNRRAWAGLHHILHPHNKTPVTTIKAVWVMAADAMTADGLATALFFVPAARLRKQYSFAYCIVHADNTIERSADFAAQLFGE